MASSKECASYMEEMLTCSVCLELVKEPQTLMQCFHNYCKLCAQQLSQNQNNNPPGVTCPLCKTFSADGEIRSNHFVKDLLEVQSKLNSDVSTTDRSCDQCPSDKLPMKATWRCLDCKANCCNACRADHSRFTALKSHRLLELTGETELVIDKLVFCKTHADKILELYCSQCKDVICIMCFAVNHNTHDTVTVEQALSKILPEVDHELGNVGIRLEDITEAIEETDKERKLADKAFNECAEKVQEIFEKRMKQMHEAENELQQKIKNQQEFQMKHLEDKKAQLLSIHKQLSNLQKVTTTSVERARHVTLLQELLQGGLLERLHKVNSEDNIIQQLQVKIPTLVMNKDNWGEFVKKGLCGQVRFSDTTLKVKTVKSIAQNAGIRYWDGDFTQMFDKQLMQTLSIEFPAYCHKVTVCVNKVFLPIRDRKVIQAYNKQGGLLNTISIEGKPVCIEKSPAGDMLVCCHDTGLFVLKEDSEEPVNIDRGKYSDMCMYDDKVYVWDYDYKRILEFMRRNVEWTRQERVVKVRGGGEGSIRDTLLVRQCEGENTRVEFFVCLWLQHTILRVSEEGEQISQYGDRCEQGEGRLCHPRVCGVDSCGQILVADWDSHKYKVVNTNTRVWTTVFTGDSNVIDAKVDNEHTVWFSGYTNGKYTITRQEEKYWRIAPRNMSR